MNREREREKVVKEETAESRSANRHRLLCVCLKKNNYNLPNTVEIDSPVEEEEIVDGRAGKVKLIVLQRIN